MPLLVTSSRDDNSFRSERDAVPPLFAGLLRDERAGSEFETTLRKALGELSEDCYAGALGKFREALALSRGHAALEQKVREAATSEVAKLIPGNWRVAEAMLFEVEQANGRSAVFNQLWADIEQQKNEDAIRLAIEESERAEHSEYLPHVRDRLLRLLETYPEDAGLRSRLHDLELTILQHAEDDREKNLGRLVLFSERLDESGNPATLRAFCTLVAPFANSYPADHDFEAILGEVRNLRSAYENASALLSDRRSRESLEVCHHVLKRRPGNILFRRLEEQAKRLAETEPEPHVTDEDSTVETFPSFAAPTRSGGLPFDLKIAITEEAWNHIKTGLAATVALLLVLLLLASNSRR